jgi:hypothetical protein
MFGSPILRGISSGRGISTLMSTSLDGRKRAIGGVLMSNGSLRSTAGETFMRRGDAATDEVNISGISKRMAAAALCDATQALGSEAPPSLDKIRLSPDRVRGRFEGKVT